MAYLSSVGYEVELACVQLSYARHEEHIDEVKLTVPCSVTALCLTDLRAAPGDGATMVASSMQAYARDLTSTHAARFAPLCTTAVTCHAGGKQEVQTEAVLTDHVVVRGRYSKLQITLSGYPDHDGPATASEQDRSKPVDRDGVPLPPVMPSMPLMDLGLPRLTQTAADIQDVSKGMMSILPSLAGSYSAAANGKGGPADTMMGDVLQLPFSCMPPVYVHALHMAMEYFSEVHRSRSAIDRNPPGDRLRPLMVEAYNICRALQGDPSMMQAALASSGPGSSAEDDQEWLDVAVDMAVSWSTLGSSPSTFMPPELQVGTAGLAAALLLCLTPTTCNAWMSGSGLQSIGDYLILPELPSDMVRLCTCICELVSVTGGAAGCDALLGWWSPPPPAPKAYAPPPPPPPRPVTGGVLKSIKEEQERREALARAASAGAAASNGGFGGSAGASAKGTIGREEDDWKRRSMDRTVSKQEEEEGGSRARFSGGQADQDDCKVTGHQGHDSSMHGTRHDAPSVKQEPSEQVGNGDTDIRDGGELHDTGTHGVDLDTHTHHAQHATDDTKMVDAQQHDGEGLGHGEGLHETEAGQANGQQQNDEDEQGGEGRDGQDVQEEDEDALSVQSEREEVSEHEEDAEHPLLQDALYDDDEVEEAEEQEEGGEGGEGPGGDAGAGQQAVRSYSQGHDSILSPSRSTATGGDGGKETSDLQEPARGRESETRARGKRSRSPSGSKSRGDSKSRSESHRSRSVSRDKAHAQQQHRGRTPDASDDRTRRRRTSKDRDVSGPAMRHEASSQQDADQRGPPAGRTPPSAPPASKQQVTSPPPPMFEQRVVRRGPPIRNMYPLLVRMLCAMARPFAVCATITRVLRRLHADELLARLQRATHQLLHGPAAASSHNDGGPTPARNHHHSSHDRDQHGRSAASKREGDAEAETALSPLELVKVLREAAGQLAELVELLVAPSSSPAFLTSQCTSPLPVTELGTLLPPPPGLDLGVLQLAQQRLLLVLLPVLVSAGYRGMAQLKAAAQAANSKSSSKSAATQASQQQQLSQLLTVHNQLITAMRALAVALASDPVGVQLLSRCKEDVAALVFALQPEGSATAAAAAGAMDTDDSKDHYTALSSFYLNPSDAFAGRAVGQKQLSGTQGPGGNPVTAAAQHPATPAHELASLLRHTMCCQAAISCLSELPAGIAPGSSSPAAAAVYTLAATACGAAGGELSRGPAVRLLAASPPALMSLLRLMRERNRVYRAAAALEPAAVQDGAALPTTLKPATGAAVLEDLDLDDADLMTLSSSFVGWAMPTAPRYARESLYASAAVLELVRELHPQVLMAWAPYASAIVDAARVEQEGLAGSAVPGGVSDDRARRMLRELQARAEVVVLAQDRGAGVLVEVLDSNLPPLVPRNSEWAASANAGLHTIPPSGHTSSSISLPGPTPCLGATVSQRDVDVRSLMSLLRAPDRAAAAACAFSLLAMVLAEPEAGDGPTQGTGENAAGASLTSRGASPEFAARQALQAAQTVRWRLMLQVHAQHGLQLLERTARTAAAALAATAADTGWVCATGDDLDDLERMRNTRAAINLACSAADLLSSMLCALGAAKVPVHSAGLLDGLLKLHAQLVAQADSIAASAALLFAPTPLVKARQQVAKALGVWLDKKWKPDVVQAALGVHRPTGMQLDLDPGPETAAGVSADTTSTQAGSTGPAASAASANLCPAELYAAACLLGDLLPAEWPPQCALAASASGASKGQSHSDKKGGDAPTAVLPPPQAAVRRAAMTAALTACEVPLRRLLSFASICESRAMRHAALRVVAKASGLSSSMPTFCVQPLLEPLTVAAKAAAGGPPIAESVRRVLEVLVPLSAKPSVKAGLLELRTAGVLARIVHHLISRMIDEAPEGAITLSMSLEALIVLLNPDVALNVSLPRDQRLAEDVPPLADLTTVVTALLAALQHLSKEAGFVRQLLLAAPAGLATHPLGRQAIRQGVIKWHLSQTGGGGSAAAVAAALANHSQLNAALSWAASRVKEVGERAQRQQEAASAVGASAPNALSSVAKDLSKLFDGMAGNNKQASSDAALVASLGSTQPSASSRFAAVLEAAGGNKTVAAGTVRGPGLQLVSDPSTLTYCKYVKMRGGLTKGMVPIKKLAKWEVPDVPQATGTAITPGGTSATALVVARLVPEGITRRKRAKVARSVAATAAAARASAVYAGTGGKESLSPGSAGRGKGVTEGTPPPASSAVPDIPVVTAPRGRGPPRRTGGGGSRPASRHVDDYERKPGGGPARPAASASSPPPTAISAAAAAAAQAPSAPGPGVQGPKPPAGPPPSAPPPTFSSMQQGQQGAVGQQGGMQVPAGGPMQGGPTTQPPPQQQQQQQMPVGGMLSVPGAMQQPMPGSMPMMQQGGQNMMQQGVLRPPMPMQNSFQGFNPESLYDDLFSPAGATRQGSMLSQQGSVQHQPSNQAVDVFGIAPVRSVSSTTPQQQKAGGGRGQGRGGRKDGGGGAVGTGAVHQQKQALLQQQQQQQLQQQQQQQLQQQQQQMPPITDLTPNKPPQQHQQAAPFQQQVNEDMSLYDDIYGDMGGDVGGSAAMQPAGNAPPQQQQQQQPLQQQPSVNSMASGSTGSTGGGEWTISQLTAVLQDREKLKLLMQRSPSLLQQPALLSAIKTMHPDLQFP